MYDVMAAPSLRGRRSARRAAACDGEAEWSPARHRLIDGDEVARLLPAIGHRRPSGGYLFYDCQTDDARLVLTVLGEAERFGTVCANRLRVAGLRPGPGTGTEATVEDREAGGSFSIRAENVVNATGVWADRIRPGELHVRGRVAPHRSQPRQPRPPAIARTCRWTPAPSFPSATGGRSSPCRGWAGP